MVYWPDVPQPGLRISYPVSLLHLVPTVVDMMGWPVDENEDMRFHWRSLSPVLYGDVDRVDDYVIVESGEGGLRKAEFLRSIEDARWKLIRIPDEEYRRGMQGAEYELYEVRTDPMETENVIADHPELANLMKELLAERLAQAGPAGDRPEQMPQYSEEEIENLRSLGYIR